MTSILIPTLVPALLVIMFFALHARLGSRRPARIAASGALAAGAGFFAGYATLRWAPLRPEQSWNCLPYVGLLIALFTAAELTILTGRTRRLTHASVAVVAAWLLVPAWADLQSARPWLVAGLAIAIICFWAAFRVPFYANRSANWPALLMVLIGLADGIILLHSGNAKFAQLSTIIAGILAAITLVARRPWQSFLWGALPCLSILLMGLLFEGFLTSYSNVPASSYVLAAACPLLLITEPSPLFARIPRRARLVAEATVIALLIGLALSLALIS